MARWRLPGGSTTSPTSMSRPLSVLMSMLVVVSWLVSTSTVATAGATPGVGIDAQSVANSSRDGRDFVVRTITIDPGGGTGWHWHDGAVVGVVQRGTLTHFGSDCQVDGVYSAGDPIVETPGAGNVHIGRNVGTEPVILEVVYAVPVGEPLAEDAANPGCPFE